MTPTRACSLSLICTLAAGCTLVADDTTTTTAIATTTEATTTTTTATTAETTTETPTSGPGGPGIGETTSGGTSTGGESSTGDPVDPILHATCMGALAGDHVFEAWDCGCDPDGECQRVGTDVDTCVCDLLAADPANEPAFACRAEAADLLSHCTDAPCGLDGYRCMIPYLNALDRCPGLPASAEVEFQCLGADVFTCADGGQVPDTWTCDGDPDCADGSDELRCRSPWFICDDGAEISAEWVCDGEADCRDGSDELGCL